MIWVRNFHLFVAGLYLVLHSIIPHHHASDHHNCEAIAQEEVEFFELLSYVFATDLGEHHLECALTTDFNMDGVHPDVASISSPIQTAAFLFTDQRVKEVCIGNGLYVSDRGPPFMIVS